LSLYAHKIGEVGTKFTVRIRAPSVSGILEDISLDNHTRLELEFLKPYGEIVKVEAEKAADSNDIEWTNTDATFLNEVGMWRLSGNVLYSDNTYIRGVRGLSFFVVR